MAVWQRTCACRANAIVHKVPAGLSAEQAAYVEPLGCALHAVERGEISVGDTVVVAGLGSIGLCMLQAARLYSPAKLIGVDLHPKRRALATEFGADVVLDPTGPDALEAVLDLTDGYGCDVYIEATGHPSGVTQGLDMVRKLGTFVEFSVFGEDVKARLDHHRRPQRAEHPRRASQSLHVSAGNGPAAAREGHCGPTDQPQLPDQCLPGRYRSGPQGC